MNELDESLKALRAEARGLRSSPESRDFLMARFEARNRTRSTPKWFWSFAAVAAALVAGVVAIPHKTPVAPAVEVASDSSDAAADPDSEGFIAVPYVPPLATGEMLRVVHTELNPAELASLGVNVDPTLTAQLPADLLLGEDGMPRAVRVADTSSESGGS
jgi:hypothetical protein